MALKLVHSVMSQGIANQYSDGPAVSGSAYAEYRHKLDGLIVADHAGEPHARATAQTADMLARVFASVIYKEIEA